MIPASAPAAADLHSHAHQPAPGAGGTIEVVRAELRGIRVTSASLEHHGALTLDPDHCEEVGILPLEFVEIWKNAAGLIAQKPWFGWGMDAAKTFRQPHDYGIMGVHSLIPWHPHNAALHIWLETGLVGAGLISALVLALTLSIVRGLGHDRRAIAGTVASIGAFCVFACVSFGIWQAWFLSTGFAAAGLIAALSAKRDGDTNAA